jgi:hypothetical protein
MAERINISGASEILLAANSITPLLSKERAKVNGFAQLNNYHKHLTSMPVNDAKKEYVKLEKDLQDGLRSFFAQDLKDEKNNYFSDNESSSILGNIWNVTKDVAGVGLESISTYANRITMPFRVSESLDMPFPSAVVASLFKFNDYKEYADGKQVFDKNLETRVDKFYDAPTVKIAKSISIGKTYGEILSSLETDEEYSAFQTYMEEKGPIGQALKDYDNAKISYGRSIANIFFDVKPGENGAEETARKNVSGASDLVVGVILDPTIFVSKFAAAVKIARYGTMSLSRASLGEKTGLQKFGFGGSIDKMFERQKVVNFWDEAGSLIQISNTGTRAESAIAITQLKRLAPDFHDDAISVFRQANITDANSAKDFLNNADNLENIMRGRVGKQQMFLPTYGTVRKGQLALMNGVRNVTGVGKSSTNLADMEKVLEKLDQGISVESAIEINKIQATSNRIAKMFERALTNRTIYIGGIDEITGASNVSKSRSQIFTLARAVLPRYESNVIADAFAASRNNSEALNIIKGLFDTIADATGVSRVGNNKQAYNEIMGSMTNQKYSEDIILDPVAKQLIGNPGLLQYNPAEFAGTQSAVRSEQLANQINIPDFQKFFAFANNGETNFFKRNVFNEYALQKAIGGSVNSRLVQKTTDYWSALNLLPRLGYRAVFDETLFNYLTMPVAVGMHLVSGRFAATAVARVTSKDEKSLGVISRLYNRNRNNFDQKAIEALKNPAQEADYVEEILVESLWGRFAGEKTAKWTAGLIRNNGTAHLKALGEGASQSVLGGPIMPSVGSIADNTGINISIAKELKNMSKEFNSDITVIPKTDEGYRVNFFAQLNNRVDRSGEIGKLSVIHMDSPAKAVREIENYLTNDVVGKEIYQRFEMTGKGASQKEVAIRSFLHTRNLFMSDQGVFNKTLLDLVRTKNAKGNWVVDGKLDIDAVDNIWDQLPSNILGYSTKISVAKDLQGIIDKTIQFGFKVSDRQLSMLSRHPVYMAYYFNYRKLLTINEEAYVKRIMAANPNMKKDIAKNAADRRYSSLASDFAYQRTIGAIDNPNVRSNLAFGVRNVARYYRANEDFYRRTARVLKNPDALIKLRVLSETIDHSGFFHEDQNGDKYFMIPMDQIMFNILNTLPGMKDSIKSPMPLSFTGKMKMLTPSIDPDSALPTFSGPLAGILQSFFIPYLPIQFRDKVEKTLYGKYAVNKSVAEQLQPAVLRRFFQIASDFKGSPESFSDPTDEIYSATFKSAAYYAANGKGLDASAGVLERKQHQHDVQQTTRNMLVLRSLLGIFTPISPTLSQTQDLDSQMLKDNVSSLKQEYQNLLSAEFAKDSVDPFSTALIKFTKIFPGAAVYSISETEANQLGSVKKSVVAADWIKSNQDIVKKYPKGFAWLVPDSGDFDIETYSFLKAEGFLKRKELDDYFMQISVVNEENLFYDIKKKYENLINTSSPDFAQQYRKQYEEEKDLFLKDKPYLKLKFESPGDLNLRQTKEDSLDDLRRLVNSNDVSLSNSSISKIRNIINIYDNAKIAYGSLGYSDMDNAFRLKIKNDAWTEIDSMTKNNLASANVADELIKRLLEI